MGYEQTPERKAAKLEWQRRTRAVSRRAARMRDVPEIPGLIPVYDKHGVVDFARVDLDDWPRLKRYRYSFAAKVYASRRHPTRYLHREVLELRSGDGVQVDHINRDTLDNRRANLRLVTTRENAANRGGRFERCWGRQIKEAA